jgi:prophage maintenance system killer protein
MRYLTLPEVLTLHERIITTTGGSPGIRDLSALESALAQPQATFDGDELYPDLVAKKEFNNEKNQTILRFTINNLLFNSNDRRK